MTDEEFRAVFELHKDVIYRFVVRMTGSEAMAEDVVQDTFLAYWNKPSAYNETRGSLRSFLMGIARHQIARRFRGRREITALNEETASCLPIDLTRIERNAAVAQAVQALPQLQREALILAEYEEFTLQEICVSTDTDLAAVKSRLHRARENLRRSLAPLLDAKGIANGKS